MSEKKTLATGITAGLCAAAIWGGWPVVSKISVGHGHLAVSDLVALRFLVAGLVLLPLAIRRGWGGLRPAQVCLLVFGAGAPYALLAIGGLDFAPASHAGIVIPGTMLMVATLGGALILNDRPTASRLIGLALVFAGVLMVGWDGLRAGMAPSVQGSPIWVGHLLFVAAGFAWASYTIGARAWRVDPLHATALISSLSLTAYLPFYLVFGESRLLAAPLGEILLQGLYQGLGSGVLALVFYTMAVARLGAARGAVFAALVPGAAVLLSIPVLGEVPGIGQVLGVALVTSGMVAALGLVRLFPTPKGPAVDEEKAGTVPLKG